MTQFLSPSAVAALGRSDWGRGREMGLQQGDGSWIWREWSQGGGGVYDGSSLVVLNLCFFISITPLVALGVGEIFSKAHNFDPVCCPD